MRLRKICSVLSLAAVMVLMGGCGDACASNAENVGNNEVHAAYEEKADWPKKLVIVQMPNENNPNAGEQHDGFRKAAEEYLGIEVEELEGTDYAIGIEAMKSNKLDVLLVSPMSYYQAKKMADAEPLVTTSSMGETPYKSVFVTRADRDDINNLEDLKGKTFAFVDPASSSGYMYPKTKLIQALDLDPEQLENPDYFFKTITYSGKHDSSIMGVVMGDYDAATIALGTIQPMIDGELFAEEDIKIIGETDIIPNACYVVRGTLPQSLKDKIKEFYLQYEDTQYFETFYGSPDIRFSEAKDSDYQMVEDMIKLLKIEG